MRARPIVDGLKQCSACLLWKSLSEFHRQAKSPSGLHYKCKPCNQAASLRWKRANPRPRQSQPAERDRFYQRRYGITVEQYDAMLVEQNGKCAICRREPSESSRLDVDHDHETGAVRALLCMQCNLAIGYLGHDPDRALVAALYLSMHIEGNIGARTYVDAIYA